MVDVTILDEDHTTALRIQLHIVLGNLALWPGSLVEDKVLVVLRVLNVAPEHIDWEAVFREVLVSLDQHLSSVLLPLAEVETERGETWDRCVATELREGLLNVLGAERRTQNKHFHGTTLASVAEMGTGAELL